MEPLNGTSQQLLLRHNVIWQIIYYAIHGHTGQETGMGDGKGPK